MKTSLIFCLAAGILAGCGSEPLPGSDPEPVETQLSGQYIPFNPEPKGPEPSNQEPKGPEASNPEPEKAGPPIGLAVVRFEDKGTSVEFNRLGAAIAEMLVHDLGQYPQLRILERRAAGDLIEEQNLAETGITAGGAGGPEKVAAGYVVTGTCTAGAGKLVVTAQLTKLGDAPPQKPWEHVGTVDDFVRFEAALVQEISASLKLKGSPRRKELAKSPEASPTLAILGLKNNGPTAALDVMEQGFGEILQSSLGAVPEVRLVDRTQLEKVLAEQAASLSGLIDPKTAVQVGQLLKAQRLLAGSFFELGATLNIQTRLVDAQTGSVVATQRVSGPREQFSQLVENLTLQILNDLALSPVESTAALVQAALPAQSMESAIHLARAARLVSEGKHPQAVEAYRQVLLLEPGNMTCYAAQLTALWNAQRLADFERTANQALARPEFAKAPRWMRLDILWILSYAYSHLNRYADLVRTTDRILAEKPDARPQVNALRGRALMQSNRRAEGIALMEEAAPGEPNPATDWKNLALQNLFWFYAFESHGAGLPESMRTSEKTREACRRAMQIFDRILISAAGKRDRDAKTWAHLFIPNLPQHLMWIDEQGYNQLYLTPAERADTMRRALEVFGWDPATAALGSYCLGVSSEDAQLWEQALSGYRDFLEACPKTERVQGRHLGVIPSNFDSMSLQPNSWIDRKIEAYYRLAKIRHDGLQQRDTAIQAYQEMVNQVGLANFRGSNAVVSMADLNVQPKYPDKAALIWGWENSGQRSWERVLAPVGYKVHSLRASVVTSAQLAPYSLVVLVRPGTSVLKPTEILALRSYVATGGSLLVVVSPGWEPAAPSIHNGLLKFFDVEAGRTLPTRVTATRIVAHPITKGVTEVMAKCGAALRAPPEATLISAGDDGLLAAKEYRFGRVVVAALGQWFLPDPTIFPGGWENYQNDNVTNEAFLPDRPFEAGPTLCRPLLENVVTWLSQRPEPGPEFIRWKSELASAHWTDWRVHARNLEWNAMAEPHEKLIAAAFDPVSREESLWVAGEAYLNLRCFSGTQDLMGPIYGFDMNSRHDPEPRHYEQLIELFPDSQLYHYAQWRLAECQRVQKLFRIGSERGLGNSPELIASFDKVSAAPGTYPWAWARLRQAALAVSGNDWSKASELLKPVMDSMPHGPERTIALATAGTCLAKAGQVPEARRVFEELSSLPSMSWSTIPDWLSQWYPVTSMHQSSRYVAIDGLNGLGRQ